MAYTPQNLQIFTAAFAGAMAGMGVTDRVITNSNASSYANLSSVAGAFAQAIDTIWGARATTLLDVEQIQSEAQAAWQDRSPNADGLQDIAATHTAQATAIIATVTAGETYFTAQGITPPAIPGGLPVGGGNYVANLTALAAIPTGSLSNGIEYYVNTLGAYFFLDAQSNATVDGITIIAAQAGGRWLRQLVFGNPKWLSIAAWYIDANNGNDENNGQAQFNAANNVGPLKTHAELARRWAGGTLFPPFDAVQPTRRICRVYILTDLPTTDPINTEVLLPLTVYLQYTGELARALVYSGTITAVTAIAAATNQAWQITDASAPWGANLGKRCRCTSAGTNLNAIFYIAKDLGAGVARISNPGTPSAMLATPSISALGFNPRTLVNGDTFVIETLPTVSFGITTIRVLGNSQQNSFTVGELICRTGWSCDGTAGVAHSLQIYASRLSDPAFNNSAAANNCHFDTGWTIISPSQTTLMGGLFYSATSSFPLVCNAGTINLVQAPLFQNSSICGTNARIASAQIFDSAVQAAFNPGGHAIVVGRVPASGRPFGNFIGIAASPFGGEVAAVNLSIFGSGNAGVGLFVGGGVEFIYPSGSTLAVTGTGGDFRLNSGTTSRAWDEAGGAYTAAINNTWTLLGTAIGAAGFGGSAHNVQANAHLIQATLS